MQAYSLQPNEVVLYKGSATFANNKNSSDILLTNLNIVVITPVKKKMFSKPEMFVNVFPVEEIKVYQDVPQVKYAGQEVEVYLTQGEFRLYFSSKSDARKFVNVAYELITGNSMSKRGAKKVKGAVNMVDETLGIDAMGSLKHVMKNGVVNTVLHGFGKKDSEEDKTEETSSENLPMEFISVTKSFLDKKSKKNEPENPITEPTKPAEPTQSVDDQIETLKKLKELLDVGILTQEEFDAKKKQILGL